MKIDTSTCFIKSNHANFHDILLLLQCERNVQNEHKTNYVEVLKADKIDKNSYTHYRDRQTDKQP